MANEQSGITPQPSAEGGDSSVAGTHAGEAFLVGPPGKVSGPGVLLLHSWWGLNEFTRDFARNIASLGFTVLAPDLFNGQTPQTAADGEAVLAGVEPNELSGLVMSSAHALRTATEDQTKPISVIGLSMGGSMALWLSARLPGSVDSVVTFYGAQSIDYDDATAVYQGHFGDQDHMVDSEERVVTESFIRLGEKHTEFHTYEGVGHWFMEEGSPNYDADAAALAWDRTKHFLLTARDGR